MNREVTAVAAVCALVFVATGAGLATDRDAGGGAPPARAGAVAQERHGAKPFVGTGQPGVSPATRAARLMAARARAHTSGGEVVSLRPGARVQLHWRPGGRALTTLGERTPFGSQAVLPVVRRKPGWLAVVTSAFVDAQVGWIRDDPAKLVPGRTRVSIEVDRSDRRLDLLRGGRRVMSAAVELGRPGSETPTGRFAVTDKLSGARYGGSYGCCILALSGRQPRLPAGWRGGDRLAIHGLNGRGGTAGCVAVPRVPLERLMRSVPLGALVTVRP